MIRLFNNPRQTNLADQSTLRGHRKEDGQAIVEYVLVLTLGLMFAILVSKTIMGSIDGGLGTVGGKLEKQLKTGRISTDVWAN